jgi:hypothetical protein
MQRQLPAAIVDFTMATQLDPGGGVIQNKHPTNVESLSPPPLICICSSIHTDGK